MSDSNRKRVLKKIARKKRAHFRVRNRVRGSKERPRLAVFKSLRYIYAQVIDDDAGKTLAQANSRESEIQSQLGSNCASKEAARLVGKTVAQRAKEKGIRSVVFDRGGYIYHGRIKELADGARGQELEF